MRVITRDEHASTEDHHAVEETVFAQRLAAGDFAVHWDAHRLRYALPAHLRTAIEAGQTVVAYGRRRALPAINLAFERVWVVHITASQEVLEQRLRARGREADDVVQDRLERHRSMPGDESQPDLN